MSSAHKRTLLWQLAPVAMSLTAMSLVLGMLVAIAAIRRGFGFTALTTTPARIVALTLHSSSGGRDIAPDAATVTLWQRILPHTVAAYRVKTSVAKIEGHRWAATVREVSGNLGEVLGVQPLLGRALQGRDTLVTAPCAVVISSRLWRSVLSGDPRILGRALTIDGQVCRVVGVIGPGMPIPLSPGERGEDLWLALRGPSTMGLVGVATKDVASYTLALAIAVRTLTDTQARGLPTRGIRLGLRSGPELMTATSRRLITTVWWAELLLLLLAVGHVVHALFAWSGGTTGRPTALAMVVIGTCVAAAGGLSVQAADTALAFVRLVHPHEMASLTGLEITSLEWRECLAIVSGLTAAATFAYRCLSRVCRRSSGPLVAKVLRIGTVSIALAMTLLLGFPGFIARSQAVGTPALDTTGVRAFYFDTPAASWAPEVMAHVVKRSPGVRDATIAGQVPPQLGAYLIGQLQLRPPASSPLPGVVGIESIRPGYFSFFGVPFAEGVDFTSEDSPDGSAAGASAVILSAALAKRLWGGGRVLGRQLRIGDAGWLTVRGVVRDVGGAAPNDSAALFRMYLPRSPVRSRGYMLVRMADPSTEVMTGVISAGAAPGLSSGLQPVPSPGDLLAASNAYSQLRLAAFSSSAIVCVLLMACTATLLLGLPSSRHHDHLWPSRDGAFAQR